MGQTYLFSKETRDEHFDTDTSYAFRLRDRAWMVTLKQESHKAYRTR